MFKPRGSIKNILKGQFNFAIQRLKLYNTECDERPLNIKKCLVVSKLSRYEFECHRHRQLSKKDLEKHLKNRGTNYEKLLYFHNLHKDYECKVEKILNDMNIEVKVVNRLEYSEDKIKWADIIMPTGGDGTFLLAASKIRNNIKPVIGFNSDPNRSEGHLCLPKKYSADIRYAVERLQSGKFKWLLRSRIRTTLVGQKGDMMAKDLHQCLVSQPYVEMPETSVGKDGKVLPFLALNEVFMGETLSARVSHLEMTMNGSLGTTNMKCSGLCVCTGTGSTSWNMSINRLPSTTVAELLRLLNINTGIDKEAVAKEIASQYNKNLIFDPANTSMAYTIRDLISAGVWPQPKGIQPRGFAKKLKVRSVCYDACLVIDGGVSLTFNDGTVAILEICPEDALRTVILED